MGGDWNCTLNVTMDRNGEERHPQAVDVLTRLVREYNLIDIWREKNKNVKQYTWVKVNDRRVSAARLDWLSVSVNNQVCRVFISPWVFI